MVGDPEPAETQPGHPIKEIRLALVCYGGVSLAIYMHGVTKEIHKLVLASKAYELDPSQSPFGPNDTAGVYWPTHQPGYRGPCRSLGSGSSRRRPWSLVRSGARVRALPSVVSRCASGCTRHSTPWTQGRGS